MVLGKKVAIFDWKWGRNSAPTEGQKMPYLLLTFAQSLDPDHDQIVVLIWI